jgi:hypothetical protein
MVEADQRRGGVSAPVQERGGQPVAVAVAGAVMAGDGHISGDDPDLDRADDRQERPVGEPLQYRRAAGGGEPDQELRLRGGDLGEEARAVEAAVHQHQHRGVQQVQQLAGPGGLPVGRGAEHRPDQRPGAGLAQGHQLDRRVAGLALAWPRTTGSLSR